MTTETTEIKKTLPWIFTGAYEGIPRDGDLNPYAIGAIISENWDVALSL